MSTVEHVGRRTLYVFRKEAPRGGGTSPAWVMSDDPASVFDLDAKDYLVVEDVPVIKDNYDKHHLDLTPVEEALEKLAPSPMLRVHEHGYDDATQFVYRHEKGRRLEYELPSGDGKIAPDAVFAFSKPPFLEHNEHEASEATARTLSAMAKEHGDIRLNGHRLYWRQAIGPHLNANGCIISRRERYGDYFVSYEPAKAVKQAKSREARLRAESAKLDRERKAQAAKRKADETELADITAHHIEAFAENVLHEMVHTVVKTMTQKTSCSVHIYGGYTWPAWKSIFAAWPSVPRTKRLKALKALRNQCIGNNGARASKVIPLAIAKISRDGRIKEHGETKPRPATLYRDRITDNASRNALLKNLGYSRDFTVRQDWHVEYYTSVFQGRRCAVLVHSHIEHIFT